MASLKDLESWVIRDFSRHGSVQRHAVFYDKAGQGSKEGPEYSIRLSLFTDTNEYIIRAVERPQNDYLGCISKCRKPRAGENWRRGNDLADGPLSDETWRAILADIVSYELVEIHRSRADEKADREGFIAADED